MLSNNNHTLILRNNNTYIIKRDGKLVVGNKLLRFLITKTFGSRQFLDKTVSNNVARCTILVSRESFAWTPAITGNHWQKLVRFPHTHLQQPPPSKKEKEIGKSFLFYRSIYVIMPLNSIFLHKKKIEEEEQQASKETDDAFQLLLQCFNNICDE